MSGPGDLNTAAAALLTASEAALATTTGGTPTRSFVSISEPSYDFCDQLAVWWRIAQNDVLQPNQPGDLMHRVGRPALNLVTFSILCLRCYPIIEATGAPPTVAALNAAGALISEDAWALWNWIRARHAEGALFGGLCHELEIVAMQPVNPQGGAAGVTLTLMTHVDGYVA